MRWSQTERSFRASCAFQSGKGVVAMTEDRSDEAIPVARPLLYDKDCHVGAYAPPRNDK